MNRKTRKLITRHLPKILLVGLVAVSVGMLTACGHVADLMMAGMLGMAVTANQLIKRQDGNRLSFPVAATTRIYEGTLVFINAAGYADDDTASGVNEFAGIAIRDVDNSGGLDGALECECWSTGAFELVGTGFAATDLGVKIYATDNYTIALASGGSGVLIGECVRFVSSTRLMVKIDVSLSETAGGDNVSAEGDIDLADGGVVTQITTAATGVTLNTHSGQITTVAQNIAAAGEVTFIVTNNKVTATDNIIVGIASGSVGGTTIAAITAIGAGVFSITLTNLHASVAETGTLVINFGVIGGSAS